MIKLNHQLGFTLIEVMVALAIVAISLSALSRAMGVTVLNQTELETRIVASWVAENEVVKMHTLVGTQVKQDNQKTIKQLDRQWKAEIKTESTAVPGVIKAVVEVSELNNKSHATRLVTVIAQ